MRVTERRDLGVEAGPCGISNRRIDEVRKALGLVAADVVNQHGLDRVNARRPQRPQRDVGVLRRVLSRGAEIVFGGRRLEQSADADVGLARSDLCQQLRCTWHDHDSQCARLFVREADQQVVIEP